MMRDSNTLVFVDDPVNEARRYVENARKVLRENGKFDTQTNDYGDRKYVRSAGHYLWTGVMIALDAVFHVKDKKGRVNISDFRAAVGPRDRKLLSLLNDAYDILHLNMGYDGVLNKKVCDEGFAVTDQIIEHCSRIM